MGKGSILAWKGLVVMERSCIDLVAICLESVEMLHTDTFGRGYRTSHSHCVSPKEEEESYELSYYIFHGFITNYPALVGFTNSRFLFVI